MGLKVGSKIPEFSLKDQHGDIFNSKDWIGKQPLVIYFYPKDNTPACTKEACEFRDRYEDFTDLGAAVIGISSDSEKTHQKFASRHDLPFLLLSDPDKKVRRLFRVENSLLFVPGRETYVIDTNGEVLMVFNNIGANGHIRNALKTLKSLPK
ncbi:peroxiredoxin [Maribacter sp. 2-571]|uniref:peroxiredoxin n=1 Tax=Maribacter sp. 2-571 TaxID=3417569 RepID=UPI003D34B66A